MGNPVILVVGAGPGIGASVARRFGGKGYDVALVSRSEGALSSLGEALRAEGITTGWSALDITDESELRAAVERFGRTVGHLDVLHFNPSAFTQKDPLALTVEELALASWPPEAPRPTCPRTGPPVSESRRPDCAT
jgi:NAD(P)-dependent dehydrogenase (short-subunit alcohol dehydrogenase family)